MCLVLERLEHQTLVHRYLRIQILQNAFANIADRLLSSLLGRKTTLKVDRKVPLPARVDDEYLCEDVAGIQPAHVHPIIDAFIVTANVFEITEHAQQINYSSLTQGLRLPELTEVLQLNEKVDQIEMRLPSYLKNIDVTKLCAPREQIFRLQADGVLIR
jgi:hypothetical protein